MSDTSKLKEINAELFALVKGIVDTRERHSINNHLLATLDWDERAHAAITKATAYAETPPWEQCGVSEGEWKAMEMIIEYGRNRRAEEGIISQKENNNDP